MYFMLKNTSEQRKKLITALAFISIPLSGFVTDIYLPSFPSMAKDLNVLEKEIQLTLTCYLLSYGISQLFVGSLLDSIGRYKPRLIALFTLVITSISIAYLDNIFYICLLRIVQGIGISILVVATRALFMDLYDTEKRAHYLSYFTVVWSCGPILAPFLGGYLEKLFNWQANFFFLAIYAGILLILDLAISGESIPEKKKFNLKNTVQLYSTMLQNKMFMLGIIILGLSYSIVMIFNIAGPFIIENTFHYNSVVIGYCTLILGFSWMLGGFVGKRRIYLEFEPRVKQPAIVQLILIGGLIAMSYFLENIWVMMPFLFLIHICSGTLFNNFFTSTMLTFPENSGTAGGLMGGLVYVITSISSFVISSTGNISGQMELSIRYIIISLLLFSTILLIVQANKKLLK